MTENISSFVDNDLIDCVDVPRMCSGLCWHFYYLMWAVVSFIFSTTVVWQFVFAVNNFHVCMWNVSWHSTWLDQHGCSCSFRKIWKMIDGFMCNFCELSFDWNRAIYHVTASSDEFWFTGWACTCHGFVKGLQKNSGSEKFWFMYVYGLSLVGMHLDLHCTETFRYIEKVLLKCLS